MKKTSTNVFNISIIIKFCVKHTEKKKFSNLKLNQAIASVCFKVCQQKINFTFQLFHLPFELLFSRKKINNDDKGWKIENNNKLFRPSYRKKNEYHQYLYLHIPLIISFVSIFSYQIIKFVLNLVKCSFNNVNFRMGRVLRWRGCRYRCFSLRILVWRCECFKLR